MNDSYEPPAQAHPWLLLIHQVPPKPDYLRVKVRRRLLRIGAQQLKQTVYAVANTADALEDLQWVRREILAMGGTALICEATFITPLGAEEVALEVMPGTTWVTRQGVYIDRIASAWLIRRFIDREAHFKFVTAHGYVPEPGEVRFDMYDGEFTHEGERCTFETLLRRFSLSDAALTAIGEIVRDIDCKAERYVRAETSGIAALIRGIASLHAEDDARVQHGHAVFDVLYAALDARSNERSN
jgi:hypothetical protein